MGDVIVDSVLVVDDEKDIADMIEICLTNDNYNVIKCNSADEAQDALLKNNIDIAILDVMMPEMDGYELCSKIRENYDFPIIMLTAKNSELDQVKGLSIGADDYVGKPFRPMELLARVKAQLRRYHKYTERYSNVYVCEDLTLNVDSHECVIAGKEIVLTPIEYRILEYLLRNKGKVVSNDELFMNVWKDAYYDRESSVITVHIRHLREKLNDKDGKQKYIKTVYGIGYKI